MRVLITGAEGLIGKHLANFLRAEYNWQVVCMDREATRPDVEKADIVSYEPNGVFQAVFNLACYAAPSEYQEKAFETMAACSIGVDRLANYCEETGAVLVHASTSEVYGDPLVTPQKEDYWGNVNSYGPRSCYDEGKRFAEALIWEHVHKQGLKAVVARIFNTYGPYFRDNDTRFIPELLRAAKAKKPFNCMGSQKSTRSYCYVGDTVKALALLSREGWHGEVYNVGNPSEHWTAEDVIRKVAKATKRPFKVNPLPARPDDPARRKPDIAKIHRLGWEPTVPLDRGLEITWEWFLRQ